jgi:putative drug exporter of the RND superfamily
MSSGGLVALARQPAQPRAIPRSGPSLALRALERRIAGPRGLPPLQISGDHRAALLIIPLADRGSGEAVRRDVTAIRAHVRDAPSGVAVAVTGAAAFRADLLGAFGSADTRLLLVTGVLVLVLLVGIYRSPIFWLIPFMTLALAAGATRGFAYLLAEAGLTVTGQSAGILSVLVFGAGTDYALLLVARYREELSRHQDPHEAMRHALGRAGPTIVASALTVALSLLALLVASVGSSASLGPIAAMGVLVATAATLTILPALLLVFGRAIFWPLIPRPGRNGRPDHARSVAGHRRADRAPPAARVGHHDLGAGGARGRRQPAGHHAAA